MSKRTRSEKRTHHRASGSSAGAVVAASPAPAAAEPRGARLFTLSDYAGTYGLPVSEATALGLSSTWRCVTVIADAIAGREWSEWRGLERLPLSRLARRPSPHYTRREWTWRAVATLALYIECAARMTGGIDSEGVPGSLTLIRPDAIRPERWDPWTMLPPATYSIGGESVSAEELVIMRRASLPTQAGTMTPLLDLARRVFAQAVSADVSAARYWSSGGSPVTVLTSEQELSRLQAEEIAERWIDRRAMGPDYPAVLGKGATAHPFGADPTRESAVEARRELVADVARLFGVPSRLVNAPEGSSRTYATSEGDGLDFVRYTLSAYAEPIADAISDLLPGDYLTGRRIRIELEELTRAEQESRFRAWESARRAKWMTRNEIRVAEGLHPIPAWDDEDIAEDPEPDPAPVAARDDPGAAEAPDPDADTTGGEIAAGDPDPAAEEAIA